MLTLPINLNAEGSFCLIVGGGTIALGKARVLAAAGMQMRVVAPFVLKEIEDLNGVEIRRRVFCNEDLDGARIVIAATDDPEINHEVHRLGHRRGMLVNCVDDPAWCDFIFPSILRRGELSVAVSTGGSSPALARMMRQSLEGEFDAEYGAALELVAEMRKEARRRVGCPGARRAANECIALMALRAKGGLPDDLRRRMEDVLELVEGAAPIAMKLNLNEDRKRITAEGGCATLSKLGGQAARGRLTLVGAGPGDPELLTLAGARALAEADLVIYDRLVNPALLEHATNAERICIGKRAGEPHEPAQERINALLVAEALAGKKVVRLKGGDPFIFGRGGEELIAAKGAGIETRVIPGITTALGAAAACELPLTHRKLASSVAFVTGCPAADSPRPAVDWQSLARSVDTIVLYMSVRHVGEIARELIAGGRPAQQPAAAIVKATRPEQELHYFTLDELGRGLAEESVEAPAIFIVGETVRLQRELAALAREALARV